MVVVLILLKLPIYWSSSSLELAELKDLCLANSSLGNIATGVTDSIHDILGISSSTLAIHEVACLTTSMPSLELEQRLYWVKSIF